jgi:hypothetical protein
MVAGKAQAAAATKSLGCDLGKPFVSVLIDTFNFENRLTRVNSRRHFLGGGQRRTLPPVDFLRGCRQLSMKDPTIADRPFSVPDRYELASAGQMTALAIRNAKPRRAHGVRVRSEIPDRGCPGLYLVLQRGGATGWAVRHIFNGESRKLTLGATATLMLAAALKLPVDLRRAGRRPGGGQTRRDAPTRADDRTDTLVAEFIAEHAADEARLCAAQTEDHFWSLCCRCRAGAARSTTFAASGIIALRRASQSSSRSGSDSRAGISWKNRPNPFSRSVEALVSLRPPLASDRTSR